MMLKSFCFLLLLDNKHDDDYKYDSFYNIVSYNRIFQILKRVHILYTTDSTCMDILAIVYYIIINKSCSLAVYNLNKKRIKKIKINKKYRPAYASGESIYK